MKRSGIRRKKPLQADPEKVREFMARGRKSISSDPSKSADFVRRGREKSALSLAAAARKYIPARSAKRRAEGPLSPAEWRKAVYEASAGRCIISFARARDADDPRFDAHHVVPKRELRARGLHGHVYDARNGVLVSTRVHERHENAVQRIPRGRLPACVWEFAQEMDALDGTSWATALVERLHPS